MCLVSGWWAQTFCEQMLQRTGCVSTFRVEWQSLSNALLAFHAEVLLLKMETISVLFLRTDLSFQDFEASRIIYVVYVYSVLQVVVGLLCCLLIVFVNMSCSSCHADCCI